MNFLHYYIPDPIFLNLGFITIRWYGLLISLAILACLWLVLKLAQEKKITADQIYDLAFWSVLGGIIGARLYEVFILDWPYYAHNLLAIFKIWQGGLAIHGAILGGALATWLWAKKNQLNFWLLTDLIVVALPLGQAIGRWGNYFNQELFGPPTSWKIGIPIVENHRPTGWENQAYFQPVFLYESLLDLFLFFGLLMIFKKTKTSPGVITLWYLLGYAVIRFMLEFIRLEATPVVWGWRWPQLVSAFIFVLSLFFLLKRRAINFFAR